MRGVADSNLRPCAACGVTKRMNSGCIRCQECVASRRVAEVIVLCDGCGRQFAARRRGRAKWCSDACERQVRNSTSRPPCTEAPNAPRTINAHALTRTPHWKPGTSVTPQEIGMSGRSAPLFIVEANGCWIWARAINRKGYGVLRGEKTQFAHRVIWNRFMGTVPPGKELDHLCRVRACVNPVHLEPVSHAENCRRGAVAKLSISDVATIRVDRDDIGTLAERYGVTPDHIRDIRAKRVWGS